MTGEEVGKGRDDEEEKEEEEGKGEGEGEGEGGESRHSAMAAGATRGALQR